MNSANQPISPPLEPLLELCNGETATFKPYSMMQTVRSIFDYEAGEGLCNPDIYLCRTHERHHWFQHYGTSIGNLLILLRRAEGIYIQTMAKSNLAIRSYLSSRAQKKLPILSFSPDGYINFDSGIYNESVNDFLMNIYSVKLIIGLISRGGANFSLVVSVDKPFERAFRLVGLTLAASGVSTVDPESVERFCSFAGNIFPVKIGENLNDEITLLHILECGAVINEIISLSHFPPDLAKKTFEDKMRIRYKKIFAKGSHLYSHCIYAAMHIFEGYRKSDHFYEYLAQIATTVAICCDLALQAPNMLSSELIIAKSWEEFYPPARFLTLLIAASKVGLYTESIEEVASYKEYITKLENVSELPFGNCNGLKGQLKRIDGEYLISHTEDVYHSDGIGVTDFNLWTMSRFQELRSNHPNELALSYVFYVLGSGQYFLIDKDLAWSATPFFSMNNKLHRNEMIGDGFLRHLALQTVYSEVHAAMSLEWNGIKRLQRQELFPELELIAPIIVENLCKALDCDEYKNWIH